MFYTRAAYASRPIRKIIATCGSITLQIYYRPTAFFYFILEYFANILVEMFLLKNLSITQSIFQKNFKSRKSKRIPSAFSDF